MIKAVSIDNSLPQRLNDCATCGASGADKLQPAAGREAKAADELARHMALIGKARVGCDIRQIIPCQHPLAAKFEAPHHHITPGAGAKQRPEIAAQAPAVSAADVRQSVEGDVLRKTGVDILPGPFRGGVIEGPASKALAADGGQGLRQIVQRVLLLQRRKVGTDVLQQRQRGAQQARIARNSSRDKGQRPAAKDLLNQRGLNVYHPVAKPLLGPCLAVMDLIGVQNHRPTGEAVLEGSGTISHAKAIEKATAEYRKYQAQTIAPVEQEYLDTIKRLEKEAKSKSKE